MASAENKNDGQIDSLLSILNEVIAKRPYFLAEREGKIQKLKEERAHLLSPVDIYKKNNEIIANYESFICDSAKTYLNENIEIAGAIGNSDWLHESQIQLGMINSMTGNFLQASEIFNKIHYPSLPDHLKAIYAWAHLKYYDNLAISADENELKQSYINQKMAWRDSLVEILDEDSYFGRKEVAIRNIEKGAYNDALALFNDIILQEEPGTHQYAMMAMGLATIYGKMGNKEKQKEYLIKSAITDMQLAVKENEALLALAELLYNEGNFSLAHDYMSIALEDANYYNSRFKNSIIARLYPYVEQSYLELLNSQRRRTMAVTWCLVGIVMVLILVVWFSIKQTKAVSRSRSELIEANRHLEYFSEKLSEANIIRENYVGYFMNQYSKAIEKLDSFRLNMKRTLKVKRYEEAFVMASRPFKNELEDLYENFDTAFLNLFPNYIDDFNSLLKPDERFNLPKGKLNNSLRIYALIRLGITDLMQIADFLHYSVQTVYNYKSKVKKSIRVTPEEFEEKVKRIGSMVSHQPLAN